MKRIENIPTKHGLESLKISESKENLSIKCQVEDRKGRKLSNDENRISKCQNELQTVAETEGFDVPEINKSYDSICDTNGVQGPSDLNEYKMDSWMGKSMKARTMMFYKLRMVQI